MWWQTQVRDELQGKSLVLKQPGRYVVEVAGLVPHVICDPAELASDEVRVVLPHVFLFIFLPSHIVFLLALLRPPWSSLLLSVPPSHAPLPVWNGREGKRWLFFFFLGTGLALVFSP